MTSSDDAPHRVQVTIGDRGYVAELSQMQMATVPTLRAATDPNVEAGEQSLTTIGFWRRSQSDWSLGAGQRVFDGPLSSRRRFFEAKRLDTWTEGEVRLFQDTEVFEALTSTGSTRVFTAYNSSGTDYLYVWTGNVVQWTTGTPGSETWTTVTTSNKNATAVAQFGDTIYYAATNIYKTVVGSTSTSTHISVGGDFDGATVLVIASGRLLAVGGRKVYEVFTDGTVDVIFEHPDPQWTWTDIAAAPNGVYLSGHNYTQSSIYLMRVDDADGLFSVPTIAMELPDETIKNISHYGGIIVCYIDSNEKFRGTRNSGVRLANVSQGGNLIYGPYLRFMWAAGEVRGASEYAYMGITDPAQHDIYGDLPGGVAVTSGRLGLAEFVSPLVPAWNFDVDYSGQEVMYDKQRIFFTSAGLEKLSSTLEATGTLYSGWVTFNTPEPKVLSNIEIAHNPLEGTVDVYIVAEDGTETLVGSSTTAGSTSSGRIDIDLPSGEKFQVKLVLKRDAGDNTKGPVVTRWMLRGIVAPERVDEMVIPLILHRNVQSPTGEMLHYDVADEYAYLKGLEAGGRTVTGTIGGRSFEVRIDGVQMNPNKWTDERDWFEGIALVRWVTVRPVV